MNPLKEYPHLFANGKFKLKYKSDKPQIFNNEGLRVAQNQDLIDDCTLIARPIEDMTDEETRNYPMVEGFTKRNSNECGKIIKLMKEDIEMEALNSKCLIYLLSIGVYPFNQDHFDDSIVLSHSDIQKQEPKNPPGLNHRMFG